MRPDELPFLELWAPFLFVVATIFVVGPVLPLNRQWARNFIFAAVWLVLGRYVYWRTFDTVLPADGAWYELTWIWFVYAVEMFALVDALILYLTLLRTSDRRAEADRHEARLRALPPAQLPSVDVYIPTYNEPLEVLEKTITGALCLDYPNFKVWVLDDGRRPWLKAFCEAKGVGYLTRANNTHAKAGNINHALTKTDAEFVAMFDADFIPQRNFLMRTMGFFADPNHRHRPGAARLLQPRPDAGQSGVAQDPAGRPALFLRSDHAEPRRLERGLLLRLELGDPSRRVAQHRRRHPDHFDHRGHAAEPHAAAQRLYHALSVRAAGLRPGA